ncbi:MAG TPA: hypothetical protein VIR45_06835 [Kiloniellaceae bacterium]
MTPPVTPFGRRAAAAVLGSSLLLLVLAACGLKPREYGPGEEPFWEREEQRD